MTRSKTAPEVTRAARQARIVAILSSAEVRSQSELAALLGYADQAHFTRDFSRVTGTTPGRFAAAHR